MAYRRNPTTKVFENVYYDNSGAVVRRDTFANVSEEARSKGVSLKGYKLAIAKANSASTPLDGYTETISTDPWSFSSSVSFGPSPPNARINSSGHGDTQVSGPRVYQVAELSYVSARAAAAFQASAHSALRSFDSGTFIGELAETVRMLRHPMESVVKYTERHCRSVRNKLSYYKVRKGRNKLVHDMYLQYVFGVKPLLNDIDDAMKTAAELSVGGVQTKHCSGSYEDTVVMTNGTITTPCNLYYDPGNLRLAIRTTARHSCQIKGAVRMTNPNSSIPGGDIKLGQRLGASMDNFIPTIYNLIPFSFVADYFSNIGEIVDGISNFNCDFAWANTSYVIEVETNCHIIKVGSPAVFTTGSFSGGNLRYKGRSFRRSGGFASISLESLYFKLPSLNQALNLANLLGSLNAARHI